MSFTDLLFQVIDFRSFSNIWYWIVLAVAWSSASHFVMGVPWDLVMRARRQGGAAEEEFLTLTSIHAGRMLHFARVSGLWLLGFVFFLHTALLLLAIWYGVEMAQAVEFIALPMTGVALLSISTAAAIERDFEEGRPEPETIFQRLRRQRFQVQLIGMGSLVVTALYGMYKTLVVVPFY
ncbi:component of SufBCD complex [Pseudoroseicyclus sp. CXY001]|uniref:component of SufBCD complex n=1 Tax=Pseudoroseicyclus sp. CXY001 TaxID=3242492 RepID=UPI00357179D1